MLTRTAEKIIRMIGLRIVLTTGHSVAEGRVREISPKTATPIMTNSKNC
jgi:hypothetical protein